MTCREWVAWGAAVLQKAGVPDAEWDAFSLWEAASGMDRGRYLLMAQEEPEPCFVSVYKEMLAKREKRIPLQHILGRTEFMGLSFRVSPDVLIPRMDTEILAERVLKDYPNGRGLRLLDMCTGSGCLAVSLSVLGHFQVAASDLSAAALAVAKQNASDHGCDIAFYEGDLFQALPEQKFDLIVSNPPYIPGGEMDDLMPEVRDFDPRMALDGGADGLYFYRRLAEEGKSYLVSGGKIYWEIGWNQAEAVRGILEEQGYRCLEVIPDLAGKDRVVTGEWTC
ncbi:peptide chain release factor N(5)-glutamine methyltransferase [Hominifimenecus sp. rT4P-3]|uniref:peptide chain release factor N(5)-glutamine methyltransferase n=1 Tax=Hominifimenecus sp. rT4P-3 TaxID=3242979 RepID=UPI003DA20ECB